MTKIFQSKMTFGAVAVLFSVATFANAAAENSRPIAPITQLGPTMPPDPWTDDGKQTAKLGPTMPPDPWTDDGK